MGKRKIQKRILKNSLGVRFNKPGMIQKPIRPEYCMTLSRPAGSFGRRLRSDVRAILGVSFKDTPAESRLCGLAERPKCPRREITVCHFPSITFIAI